MAFNHTLGYVTLCWSIKHIQKYSHDELSLEVFFFLIYISFSAPLLHASPRQGYFVMINFKGNNYAANVI